MRIQLATKQTVLLISSVFYLGSLIGFITHLGLSDVANSSWFDALLVASVATWAVASFQNVYRRVRSKVWEIKHGNTDGETSYLRPSTHSTINSTLHMASTASSLGYILSRAPNLTSLDFVRIPGYGLWFTSALHTLVLARTIERQREKSPKDKHRLCGLPMEAHAIMSISQIEGAGVILGTAIWLDDTLSPARAAGNVSWLIGASIALSVAIYDYVQVRNGDSESGVAMEGGVKDDPTENNEHEGDYSASLKPGIQ